jgi:hypothetical protein
MVDGGIKIFFLHKKTKMIFDQLMYRGQIKLLRNHMIHTTIQIKKRNITNGMTYRDMISIIMLFIGIISKKYLRSVVFTS